MFVFWNPCARAKLHQQERALKLCSATLTKELKLITGNESLLEWTLYFIQWFQQWWRRRRRQLMTTTDDDNWFPPRSKDFFFTSCGSLIPFTRANAQWVIHGFN